MIVPKRDAKCYGAVHIDNYLTFTGFCKKVYSDEVQNVDVFLDGLKISTIMADKKIPKIEQIYDIEGHGFEYDLAEEYFDRSHLLEFKADSGEELVNSRIQTIDKNHPKFNEYKFLHSLSNVDVEKIKDLYCPNSIGFLAYEESLKDEQFIKGIKELSIRFPQVVFKAFYLNAKQREEAETLFSDEAYRIEIVVPKNIYDIAKNIEIFLYPNHASRNVYLLLIKNSTKIACLDIMNKQKTIHEIDLDNKNHTMFTNPSHYGITQKDMERYGSSYAKMAYERIYNEVTTDKYEIDTSLDGYEFYVFERVRLILNINGYKERLINNVFRKFM